MKGQIRIAAGFDSPLGVAAWTRRFGSNPAALFKATKIRINIGNCPKAAPMYHAAA
jgi:hypothetical protein